MTVHRPNPEAPDLAVQKIVSRDRASGAAEFNRNYMCDNLVYNDATFKKRFRILRERFIQFCNKLEHLYEFL